MLLYLGEPLVRLLCCCCCSFLMCILICWCSSFCCCCSSFISRLLYTSPALYPGFSDPWRPPTALSFTPTTFWLPFLFHLSRALRFWVGIFYRHAFFTLRSFPTVLAQPAFIKASLGAGRSSLKFAGIHTDLQNTAWPICLFDSQ